MRIISKTHDFYDSSGFVDQSVIFIRKEDEVTLDIKSWSTYTRVSVKLLGFCGKFYPYIHRTTDSYYEKYTGKFVPEKNFYFYRFEEYQKSSFWVVEKSKRYYKEYTDFFAYWKDTDKPFIELDAPYFRVKKFADDRNIKGVAITNPSLIDMQFGKVMDASTVFQTIQFYLTNQLVKTKDPDEIEDKYRLANHGFDKHSFRNPIKFKDLK